MARADLILDLVEAALGGNQARIRSVVEALAAEERRKNHGVFSRELSRLLDTSYMLSPLAPKTSTSIPSDPGVLEIDPKIRLRDLILPGVVERELATLVEEQHRVELLRAYNLEPRSRVLLVGPPGNGKTSCAEGIATELAVPLLVLRYESVITSFLGETSARLNAVLDDVRRRHCVLFIDEFDTLAKERGDEHDTGEIKRIVSSLLLQLDRLPSHVVVCAATNHSELLDRAVWRRFQLRLNLSAPSKLERQRFARLLATRFNLKTPETVDKIVEKLGPRSYAELEEFFMELRRRQILTQGGAGDERATVNELLAAYRAHSGLAKRSLRERDAVADAEG